jgi:flavorubredoxin
MAVTTEIVPNIYRISIFAQSGNLQFNHFLVKDDEPLLFHTRLRGMPAEVREAVPKLINLSELRHISFSHFESDECGSLNEWLAAAPKADVICSQVGALVCVNVKSASTSGVLRFEMRQLLFLSRVGVDQNDAPSAHGQDRERRP